MKSRDGMVLVMKKTARSRKAGGRSCGRMLEGLESRVLLTSATLPVADVGTWRLAGEQKAGTITFGYHGTVNGVNWKNSNGTTESLPSGGGGGSGASAEQIQIGFGTQVSGSLSGNSYSWTGGINANDDVMAVTDGSTNELNVLVRNAGSYSLADFAGTWRISGEDYYGFVSVGTTGHVTNGFIFLNNGTGNAVNSGTVTVNAAGQGVLDIVTGFGPGHADFSNLSLDFTMNSHKDVAVANTSGLGNGTDSHLTVMVKATKGISTSSFVGPTWTLSGVNGSGSLTFLNTTNFTGLITRPGQQQEQFGGTYTLTSDGVITFTTQFGTVNPTFETLTGRINTEGNVMALADVSGDPASDMMVLIAQGSHTPTSNAKATLAAPATQTRPYSIDLNTLINAAQVKTVDGTVLGLKFTKVPVPSVGSLTIAHLNDQGIIEIETVDTSTLMVSGDTLTWTPSASSQGSTLAFDIQGISDNHLSLVSTQVFITTVALPTVTVATKGPAKEVLAGSVKGNGTIVITRAGGDMTQALTVQLSIGGTGQMGVTYNLVGPAGTIVSTTPTVTILAGQKSVTLIVVPIQDNTADPTWTVTATVEADPNVALPSYVVGVHNIGEVDILDGSPVVSIKAAKSTAQEASPTQHPGEFLISRTGSTTGTLTVNFNTVSGTAVQGTDYTLQDAQGNVLTNTLTIPIGAASFAVFLIPIDNHINTTTQFATMNILGSSSYNVAPVISATVKITNENRVPTAANLSVAQNTPKNTALSLTFDQLVALMGAAVGSGSAGTLQLKVSAVGKGTLQNMPGGGAAVALPKGGVISEGDTLMWTPALNATGSISAFTLVGVDGFVSATKGSVFKVTVGP